MPQNDSSAAASWQVATNFTYGQTGAELERCVPVEVPVNIVFAPVPYAVFMLTPQDIEDFVHGFSRTEGIIESAQDIRNLQITQVDGGLKAEVTLASDRLQRHLARTRSLSGRTGCGVCGIEDMASLPFAKPALTGRVLLKLSSIRSATRDMAGRQELNIRTRAVHAAAWCTLDGKVDVLREDVGRHNALDKLIGALMRAGTDPASGFIAITSRCSFEMVEKAAAFGASAIVAVSAPTSLAIQRAEQHDMLLLAVARDDGALAFAHSERVVDDISHPQGRRCA